MRRHRIKQITEDGWQAKHADNHLWSSVRDSPEAAAAAAGIAEGETVEWDTLTDPVPGEQLSEEMWTTGSDDDDIDGGDD